MQQYTYNNSIIYQANKIIAQDKCFSVICLLTRNAAWNVYIQYLTLSHLTTSSLAHWGLQYICMSHI